MRAVVTGSAGFLGCNVVQRLVNEGAQVIALDSREAPRWQHDHPLIECVQTDLTAREPIDEPTIDELVRLVRPDEIWHLASHASPIRYKRRAIETLRLGGEVTDRLLRWAHYRNARLLFASSSEVYGDPPATEHPQREEYRGNVSTVGPRSMYDESKRYGEALCAAHRAAGADARIARIFNTYGPCMDFADGRLVPSLLTAALAGRPFQVHGTGDQTRTLCYVDDLLDGLWTLMRAPSAPEPVNVGGVEELTIMEIVLEAQEALGRHIQVEKAPAQDEHDPIRRRPDLTRIKALGWEGPRVSLQDGLQRTARWAEQATPPR